MQTMNDAPVGREPDRLLTIREAGGRLGLSVSGTYRLLSDGSITGLKLGRSTRIRESEVARFIGELPVAKLRAAGEGRVA